ncbi:MAG: hypothetical protein KGK33_17785 [Hyphomicrobiales bacterium]|nr:hypothetical protein [Hyphomicrobiales bacterium]
MLPRALDGAIGNPWIDAAKFLSLPLLAGLPLGLSWSGTPPPGRAFIWANFIPKLGAPVRLCAYYRLDQQAAAGWALIAVAGALGISWFRGFHRPADVKAGSSMGPISHQRAISHSRHDSTHKMYQQYILWLIVISYGS